MVTASDEMAPVNGESVASTSSPMEDDTADVTIELAEVEAAVMVVVEAVAPEVAEAVEAVAEAVAAVVVVVQDDLSAALKMIQNSSKPATTKSAVSAILKMLQNLQKRPSEVRNRKINKDNILIKKFVLGVAGALDYLKAVGFVELDEGPKKQYLVIEEAQVTDEAGTVKLERAVALLTDVKDGVKAVEKEIRERVQCLGGCGFWGDPKADNYCSVCHKKKYFSVKAAEPAEERVKCGGGCGFYGSKAMKGYCSQCHKVKFPPEKKWKGAMRRAMCKLKVLYRFKKSRSDRPVQTDIKKCWTCRRKIGLAGIECRCGYIFCGNHRYAEQHDCIFDHRRHQRNKLRRENEIVKTENQRKFEKFDS
jgi:hypothetical protein